MQQRLSWGRKGESNKVILSRNTLLLRIALSSIRSAFEITSSSNLTQMPLSITLPRPYMDILKRTVPDLSLLLSLSVSRRRLVLSLYTCLISVYFYICIPFIYVLLGLIYYFARYTQAIDNIIHLFVIQPSSSYQHDYICCMSVDAW